MEKKFENKILLYALLSAFGFVCLILAPYAGLSVPVFMIIQIACLWFLVPERKKLWPIIPVFIMSLNSFISASRLWSPVNFLLSIALYSFIFVDFNIKDTSVKFITDTIKKVFEPVKFLHIPVVLLVKANKEKASLIKRVFIALIITIPSLVLLTAVLALSDMVFSKGVGDFFTALFNLINFEFLFKTLFGIAVGFYLFGLLYSARIKKEAKTKEEHEIKADLIILNIFMLSILAVYTIFIIVQFTYLFAGARLPEGLTYTEYARKGFFEQFSLTGVNIAIIWIVVRISRKTAGRGAGLVKALCCYLCAVTIVLLISSFYRMRLYYLDDGLTRLRFFVFGFLIFEFIGLLITFFYIIRPKFNVLAVYLSLGLAYYLLLNIIPSDYFIAKNQVDRYLRGESNGIFYTLTLSIDAAPQLERLLDDQNTDEYVKSQIKVYFKNRKAVYEKLPHGWRQYNLSERKFLNIQ